MARMTRWLRSWSIGTQVFFSLLLVVLLPIAVGIISVRNRRGDSEQIKILITKALTDSLVVIGQLQRLAPAIPRESLETVARQHSVRIRVLSAQGLVFETHNYHVRTGFRPWLALQVDPRIANTLNVIDQELPPLNQRAQIAKLWELGHGSSCTTHTYSDPPIPILSWCLAGARVETPSDSYLIVAEQAFRRDLWILYDIRYQLLLLAVYLISGIVVPLGLVLSWWLSRPLRRLRQQCQHRAAGGGTLAPMTASGYTEIDELVGAFNYLLTTLAERNRQNEIFVDDVAHEMKNPIAAIRACGESLQRTQWGDSNRQLRVAQVLLESSGRLDAMVSQFLDLARADAGLPAEERELLDLSVLVGAVIDGVRADERYHNVRFETHLAPCLVVGVPGRLESAARNLLDNAASFAAQSSAEPWVKVGLSKEAHTASLTIQDSGPGISPENLPKLFSRFFTTRPEHRGSGLGLAMAQAIFVAHGGSLGAASPDHSGAIFTAQILLAGPQFR